MVLAKSFSQKSMEELDESFKNIHLRTLEIDHRYTTNLETFIQEKQLKFK